MPAAQAGRSTAASSSGRAAAASPLRAHWAWRAARPGGQGRGRGQHVADPQARAGQQLGQRPDDHGPGLGVAAWSTSRWPAARTPRPTPGAVSSGAASSPVGLCGLDRQRPASGSRAGQMATVEGELGLVDPAGSELGGHQGDALGAAVGEQEPIEFDAHARRPGPPWPGRGRDSGRWRRGGGRPPAADPGPGDSGWRTGRAPASGRDAEGPGQPGAVATVGAGGRRDRAIGSVPTVIGDRPGEAAARAGIRPGRQRHRRRHVAAEPDGPGDVGRPGRRPGPEAGTDAPAARRRC